MIVQRWHARLSTAENSDIIKFKCTLCTKGSETHCTSLPTWAYICTSLRLYVQCRNFEWVLETDKKNNNWYFYCTFFTCVFIHDSNVHKKKKKIKFFFKRLSVLEVAASSSSRFLSLAVIKKIKQWRILHLYKFHYRTHQQN